MSQLDVYDSKGAAVGDVELADGLMVLDRGEQAVHDSVVQHRARQRAGTASTLSKGEVAGSGQKPWRQKGLGRARAGYRQSPVWRGGGVAFGPKPRAYGGKVNRKVGRLAFCRAFSERVAAGDVRVIESLSIAEPRTKLMADTIKALGITGKVLFVVDQAERNVFLAMQNLADAAIVRASDVNTYQVLLYRTLVVTRAGLDKLTERLGAGAGGAK